ncbi:hypothetical protein PISMIDRAFT_676191 [Pisolithus microcarpus 441]|uniref:Uncharacterized protein n=1 Tax=Pisolithus microcarpus 441 TaxID=765257 RepID=A0A0C9ZVV8_9AGAM|nr:hypothetical protein PISMIDRAFT_676191 [Pisolithus microcarpus 441]
MRASYFRVQQLSPGRGPTDEGMRRSSSTIAAPPHPPVLKRPPPSPGPQHTWST